MILRWTPETFMRAFCTNVAWVPGYFRKAELGEPLDGKRGPPTQGAAAAEALRA